MRFAAHSICSITIDLTNYNKFIFLTILLISKLTNSSLNKRDRIKKRMIKRT